MIIHNPILTGSFTVNGTDVASITGSAASITAINAYTASQNILNGTYATTGSNTFKNPQTINSNLIVTGSITAATLVVQTITSSVIYSSGSNVFGNNIANTQTFTGSLLLTGSMGIGTIPQDCQLHITGSSPSIKIGGARTYLLQTVDTDGRFRIHDNTAGERFTITSGSGFVGIGTVSPTSSLDVRVAIESPATGKVALAAGTSNGANDIFRWYDGTTQLGVFKNSGNVGIGVTNPSAKLEVGGTIFSTVRSATIDTDDGVSNNFQGYGGYWALRTDLTNNFNIDVYNNGTPKTSLTVLQLGGNVGIGTNNPPKLLTLYTAGSTIMRFQSGAATTDHWDAEANTSARFYISNVSSGNGAYLVYNSASGWVGVSDARWKTNWTDLGPSLSLISQLKIGKYKMLDKDKQSIEGARWDYGIKAQELLDIIPDAVDVPKDENDKYGVLHNIVFYHAIKAIQELKTQIDDLQAQITELKNK